MKIYIASSWKNAEDVRELAKILRENGHKVFDFTDENDRPDGLDKFVFNAESWSGKPLETIDWLEFLEYSATGWAFKSDKGGLDWADLVILLIPSGKSSHMEAGYIVGSGKELYILGDLPPGEFDTMYKFAKGCFRTNELPELLKVLKEIEMTPGKPKTDEELIEECLEEMEKELPTTYILDRTILHAAFKLLNSKKNEQQLGMILGLKKFVNLHRKDILFLTNVIDHNNQNFTKMLDGLEKFTDTIQQTIDAIQKTDRTPLYGYDKKSVNRLGEEPKKGKRWQTPYEITTFLQQDLEKHKKEIQKIKMIWGLRKDE